MRHGDFESSGWGRAEVVRLLERATAVARRRRRVRLALGVVALALLGTLLVLSVGLVAGA